jgi:ATP-dependent DNA ligase
MTTKLYQLDTEGNIKLWEAEVINKGKYSEFIIRTGRLDGKMIETVTTVYEGKNIGKVNGTNHFEQANLEMESKIALKLKKGYVSNLKEAKSSGVLGSGVPAPMLAQKYHPTGAQSSSKTLAQLKLTGKHIIVQPKLDGNRCLIKVEDGTATMYTRSGDVMPVQLDHIIDDVLAKIYDEDFILDGELFSNEISFNTLNGLIKREKANSEEKNKRKLIKYHLYDVMNDEGYEVRGEFIKTFASDNIIIVPSKMIVATDDNIQKELEIFLAEGHEGLMIRQLGMGYDHKRSWQLCKDKIFEDSEYKLVGFLEDSRGGFVGSFVMEDKDGTRFNAGSSGQSVEERTAMWYNEDEFIGKMATVAYFGKSEYNIPRFPKFKGLR